LFIKFLLFAAVLHITGVCGSEVVSHAELSSKRSEVRIPTRTKIWFQAAAPLVCTHNSAKTSSLTVHCRWEDEMARERICHQLLVCWGWEN